MCVTLQAQGSTKNSDRSLEKLVAAASGLLMHYSDPSSVLPHWKSWPLASRLSHDIDKLLYYWISPKVTFVGKNDEKEGTVVTAGLLDAFENSKVLFKEADSEDIWEVDTSGLVKENKMLV